MLRWQMMSALQSSITELRRIVGPENVLTEKEDLIPYSFDGTAALRQMPGMVVFVRSSKQVSEILSLANKRKVPVVARGSRTGLRGRRPARARVRSAGGGENGGGPGSGSREFDVDRRGRGDDPNDCRGSSGGRFVLSAGSRGDEDIDDWRQRGGECRRVARSQVWHHSQLCDGIGSGAAEWGSAMDW